MSWTLPAGWSRKILTKDEFEYTASDLATLRVRVDPMAPGFPIEMGLQSYYLSAQARRKNRQLDEVKWLELDHLRGVQVRDSGIKPDGTRSLQWTSVRKFAGDNQLVSLSLSVNGASFENRKDEFYAILNSTKIAH